LGLLVDTNVFIRLERSGSPPTLLNTLYSESLSLSAVTATELLFGLYQAESATRRQSRQAFIDTALATFPVLAVDLEVARVHAQIWAQLSLSGQLIPVRDLFIAATAVAHGLTLLTQDTRDFARVNGLDVLQPNW